MSEVPPNSTTIGYLMTALDTTQTTDFFPSAIALPDPQGQRVQELGQHRWRRYHSKLMPN